MSMRTLLRDRTFLVMVLLLILQQTLVASSTLWLAHLVENIHAGQALWGSLLLYAASLLLPYLPGAGALIALEAWHQRSLARFVDAFARAYSNKIRLWSRSALKERASVTLSKDGPQTLQAWTEYVYGLLASLLNMSLSILVVAYVIDARLLVTYGVAFLAALGLVKVQARKNRQLSLTLESRRQALGTSLFRAWDDVVLGNRWCRALFDAASKKQLNGFKRAALASVRLGQTVAVGVALVTVLPCLAIVALALTRDSATPAAQLAVAATLPRLFQILNSTHTVLSALAAWSAQRGRFDVLCAVVGEGEGPADLLETRIDTSLISVEPKSPDSAPLDAGAFATALGRAGRFTLRGRNGAGKSTFLLLLKERLGDRAFHLPARHDLSFAGAGLHGSSGQKAAREIEEILGLADVDVVLLDEWDAHLDDTARRALSIAIDRLARKKAVVEVRHANDSVWKG